MRRTRSSQGSNPTPSQIQNNSTPIAGKRNSQPNQSGTIETTSGTSIGRRDNSKSSRSKRSSKIAQQNDSLNNEVSELMSKLQPDESSATTEPQIESTSGARDENVSNIETIDKGLTNARSSRSKRTSKKDTQNKILKNENIDLETKLQSNEDSAIIEPQIKETAPKDENVYNIATVDTSIKGLTNARSSRSKRTSKKDTQNKSLKNENTDLESKLQSNEGSAIIEPQIKETAPKDENVYNIATVDTSIEGLTNARSSRCKITSKRDKQKNSSTNEIIDLENKLQTNECLAIIEPLVQETSPEDKNISNIGTLDTTIDGTANARSGRSKRTSKMRKQNDVSKNEKNAELESISRLNDVLSKNKNQSEETGPKDEHVSNTETTDAKVEETKNERSSRGKRASKINEPKKCSTTEEKTECASILLQDQRSLKNETHIEETSCAKDVVDNVEIDTRDSGNESNFRTALNTSPDDVRSLQSTKKRGRKKKTQSTAENREDNVFGTNANSIIDQSAEKRSSRDEKSSTTNADSVRCSQRSRRSTKRKIFIESEDSNTVSEEDDQNSDSDSDYDKKEMRPESEEENLPLSEKKSKSAGRPKRNVSKRKRAVLDSDDSDLEEIGYVRQHRKRLKGNFESESSSDEKPLTNRRPSRQNQNTQTKYTEGSEGDGCDTKKKTKGRKSADKDKNQSLLENEEDLSKLSNKVVTCQVCFKQMTEETFVKTHKQYHNALCWTEHEEPIDLYNPVTVLEILWRKRKHYKAIGSNAALSFQCPNCDKVVRSELGYYSHILVCGKTEDEVSKAYKTCELCDKNIFLPHYRAHELKHVKESESTVVNEDQPEAEPLFDQEVDIAPGSKRSAARRAQSKISKITQNLQQDEGGPGREDKKDKEFVFGEDLDNEEEEEEIESDGEEEWDEDEEEAAERHYGSKSNSGNSPEQGLVMQKYLWRKFVQLTDLKYAHDVRKSIRSALPLYEQLIPSYAQLDEQMAEQYLPLTKKSMEFASSNREIEKLDLFSYCQLGNDGCTLFCGGPVWAMAWCPQDSTVCRSDQYLAIATHRDMNKIHEQNISHSYKSMIQIWKVPQMSCVEVGCALNPHMIFGIAHEEGAIWNLDWCPSGGLLPGRRLGLLAAACSSGKVLIYAVPHPDNLDEDSRCNICYLDPVFVLQIDDNLKSPCLRLAWQREAPHNLLYAGYGDGYVALFDISTGDDTNEKVLLPFTIFQAHHSAISVLSLSLCKKSKSILLTSGGDRDIRVWTTSDLSVPIQEMTPFPKKILAGDFTPYLPLHITGCDVTHFSDVGMQATCIRDLGYVRDLSRFHIQQCPVFTLTCSLYAGCVLVGTEDGDVYLYHYANSLFNRLLKKSRITLLKTRLVAVSKNEGNGHPAVENELTSSYEYMSRNYKLVLNSKEKNQVSHKIVNEEYDGLNFTSSCWNNNSNNFQYVAAGQKCGFVHIINSNIYSRSQVTNFFNKIGKT